MYVSGSTRFATSRRSTTGSARDRGSMRRAPLFIQHGANDPRVPLEETEQIHKVLTEKGIRCELLVHADEGHAIGKLENRVQTFERAAAFLDDVL